MQQIKWTKRKQCAAVNCKNYQCTRSDLAFHRFPKDPQRCATWVQNLRIAALHDIPSDQLHRTYRVCSAHFHSSQFKRPPDVHGGLKWDAVPTKISAPDSSPPIHVERKHKPPKTCQELKKRKQNHVPSPSKEQDTEEAVAGPSSQVQYTEEAVAGPSSIEEGDTKDVLAESSSVQCHLHTAAVRERLLTMKIRALKTQVSKLRSKVKQLRQTKVSRAGNMKLAKKELVTKELQRLLPAKAYAFVHTQLRMSQRKCQGYRWTTQDKAFFLSLWHASPKCYRLLCRVFSMPSVRTLQKKHPGN